MKMIYELYGYFNMFHLIPDFVYPVFRNGSEYYFADGDERQIKDFIKLKKESISQIQPIKCGLRQNGFQPGSKQIYIYQCSESEILIGSGSELCQRLSGFQTNSDILQKDLQEFLAYFQNRPESKYNNPTVKYYGTGRRKSAIARVYLVEGRGNITINRRNVDEYFGQKSLKKVIIQPMLITDTEYKFDVIATVKGGGCTGQAGAIRHGIARALLEADANYRPILKKAGYLTRDARMKERKKYGLKAARRAPQFCKR